jgi:hypothetical protein
MGIILTSDETATYDAGGEAATLIKRAAIERAHVQALKTGKPVEVHTCDRIALECVVPDNEQSEWVRE